MQLLNVLLISSQCMETYELATGGEQEVFKLSWQISPEATRADQRQPTGNLSVWWKFQYSIVVQYKYIKLSKCYANCIHILY